MPAMANISVLSGAAATVVYVAASPSAGDRSPAVWRANALSVKLDGRPTFTCLTRDNGKRTARHLSMTYKFPVSYTDSTTGLTTVFASVPISVECTLPTNLSTTILTDAFTQFGNLLVSSLIRGVADEGYAPT